MDPLVDRLEQEKHVKVERLETWHDAANAEKLAAHDDGFCGGVPFFINTDTGARICGAVAYEGLVEWAA
jgi:hypothetical protein